MVVLTKDSLDYHDMIYELDSIYNYEHPYFKKDCTFRVIECGLSKNFVTKADSDINPVNPECSEEFTSYLKNLIKAIF